jgi:3D (Asp-Asp-Asp) domain-containing protein
MKINSLKILIIFVLFLFSYGEVKAACSWVEKTSYYNQSERKTEVRGGCSLDIQTENNDTNCAGTKPTYEQVSGTAKFSVCCCDKILAPQISSKNVCTWEKQTAYYDQLKRETVTTSCPNGKVNYNDKDCSGIKPTYPVENGVSNKAICCCKDGTISKVTTTNPKFKLPDYIFQIPIGTLSKLNTVDCSEGTCKIPFISQYISAIYDYGLAVAGVFGVLMLMAAGLLWIVSGGDSGKITKAKQLIFGSVTGLLLLVGLNLFLSYINPDLIKNKSIELANIERIDILSKLADSRNGGNADSFKNSGCATDAELAAGVDFYATGYFKPPYTGDANFFCVIAMQCSCPNGTDNTKVCDIYKKTYPNYHPCKDFTSSTPYCNMTSSGSIPQLGDIAGPDCSNLKAGTYVCFKGKTYKITDRGGGIKGKRIDIWSGSDLNKAYANTGVGKLTIGACK